MLQAGEIRGLPEGTALMLYKGLNPMLVTMTAYYRRRDAATINAARTTVEQRISTGIAHLHVGSWLGTDRAADHDTAGDRGHGAHREAARPTRPACRGECHGSMPMIRGESHS